MYPNRLKKEIRKYIKGCLGKGYSINSIEKALVNAGYHKHFVKDQIRNTGVESMLNQASLFIVIITVALMLFTFNSSNRLTGFAVSSAIGCCEAICQETSQEICPSKFYLDNVCGNVDACVIGCCKDNEGYCLSNYLKGNCERQNFTFAKKACSDIYYCTLIIEQPSIRGYTGFEEVFNLSMVNGFGLANPLAIVHGGSVNIGYYIYDNTNVTSVMAEIKSADNALDSFALYDDGQHNDRNMEDHFYAVNWNSIGRTVPEGLSNYHVDIKIMKGSSEVIKENVSFFAITTTKCLPIANQWREPSIRNNLVFIANRHDNFTNFGGEVRRNIEGLTSIVPFNAFKNNFNFYRIDYNYDLNDNELLNQIKSECPFFDEDKDLIISLESTVQECSSNGGLAKIMPQTFYSNPNILNNLNLDFTYPEQALQNFCSYTFTMPQLNNYVLIKAIPPTARLLTENESVFSNYNASFDFIITDNLDNKIDYELVAYKAENMSELADRAGITLEELLALSDEDYLELLNNIGFIPTIYRVNGAAINSQLTSSALDYMEAGIYDVWIEGTDSNDNLNVSNIITVYVRAEEIELAPIIISPQNNSVINELVPEIEFTISYLPNTNINYSILLDGVLDEDGTILSDEIVIVYLSEVTEGIHNITLRADYGNISANLTITLNFSLQPEIPAPPKLGYKEIIETALIMILAFLMAVAIILYHRE